MKKIIICGFENYVERMSNEIKVVATIVGQPIPEIITESQDSQKMLTLAKEEKFPLFILDKNMPYPSRSWIDQEGFNLASQLRRARNESVEQYSLPNKQKAFIIIFSKDGYSFSERGDMSSFWSPNIFLKEGRDATESEVATVAVGTQVFNGEWMLPAIANTLHEKFVNFAR